VRWAVAFAKTTACHFPGVNTSLLLANFTADTCSISLWWVCYTNSMGNQTYQKRQKELARQQKQRDKAARREQRKAEKKKGGPPLEGEDSVAGEIRPGSQAQGC
jgi:hypothetical protein